MVARVSAALVIAILGGGAALFAASGGLRAASSDGSAARSEYCPPSSQRPGKPKRPGPARCGRAKKKAKVSSAAKTNRPLSCDSVRARVLERINRNRMKLVLLAGAGGPGEGRLSYRIDAVTQDEPVKYAGDHTFPDAKLTRAGPQSNRLLVRAEHDRNDNGRVYRIAFSVTTAGGRTCSRTAGVDGNTGAKVSVPRKKRDDEVDDGDSRSWSSFTGRALPHPVPSPSRGGAARSAERAVQ